MKILMAMPNYIGEQTIEGKKTNYYLALGLMYVSSYLKSKDFDVHTINLNHYGPKKLNDILSSGNFDVLCTGGIHVDIHRVMGVVEEAKKVCPNIITIVGGSMATSDPDLVLDIVKCDYLVLKEGEQTCADLISTLEQGGDAEKVLGIAYKKDGKYFETPGRPLLDDLDSLPFPDYEGFEYTHYLENHAPKKLRTRFSLDDSRPAMVTGSRDCPAKCTFCFRNMGGDYRERTVDSIMLEIRYLIDTYGVNQVDLNDEIFALNRNRVNEFCEKIKPFNIPWSCQMRVNLPEDEILRRMKDAGCCHICYGFESASPIVLKSMKKGIRVEQIENAIQLTKKHQISLTANWIFGDPAETVNTALETLEFNRRHADINLSMFPLVAYPGTSLYFDVLAKDIIKDKVNFYLTGSGDDKAGVVNLTKMTHDERCALDLKLRLECEQLHLRGKITACEHTEEDKHNVSVICPVCGEEHLYNMLINAGIFSVSTSLVDICKSCYSRFALNYYDFAGFQSPIKKALIKSVNKVLRAGLFLMSLKFEPEFYKDKRTRYLYFPIYLLVDKFKLNTLMLKLVWLVRKARNKRLESQSVENAKNQAEQSDLVPESEWTRLEIVEDLENEKISQNN